jgi:transmembrane sensor
VTRLGNSRFGDFCKMLRRIGTDPARERSDKLKRDAIAWISLLSSGKATLADAEAMKRWCAEDPAHARAYASVAQVWHLLTPVAAVASTSKIMERERGQATRHAIGRRAFLGGALAASAACAAYTAVNPPLHLWPSLAELRADIRTGTGQQRRVEIASGLAVDLNTRSSIAVRSAPAGSNAIELISGEAVVSAGPDPGAICVIVAGDGRTVARNARVDVRQGDSRIRVACLDGTVRVEHRGQAVTLSAGQQVVYDDTNISGIGAFDAAVVTAWQEGRLVFRGEPLSQVIDEVNRYRPGRLILVNRDLGRHLIDASFNLDRLDNVVIYIRQAFDARITTLPGGLVLIG